MFVGPTERALGHNIKHLVSDVLVYIKTNMGFIPGGQCIMGDLGGRESGYHFNGTRVLKQKRHLMMTLEAFALFKLDNPTGTSYASQHMHLHYT